MPERIQLRRTAGWRKPEGAIVVARPSKWGNPFTVGGLCTLDIGGGVYSAPFLVRDRQHAVKLFETWQLPGLLYLARVELAGHDLACWCPPGAPCHADSLLRAANSAPAALERPA